MRLIDADALINKINQGNKSYLTECLAMTVCKMIDDIPTITVTQDGDLISRQDAIDRINKQREHLRPDMYPQDKIGDAAYRICAEFIERLPSAQQERKRGEWIVQNHVVCCSECGEQNMEWNFCPYCGADMRGDKTND